MENLDNYKPKFDPETGLPLTDNVVESAPVYQGSISPEVAEAGQPVHPEAPFTAVTNTEENVSVNPVAQDAAPFQAVAQDNAYQAVNQDAPQQAPYQAVPQSAPYEATPQQAPYQVAPQQTPYQQAPYQATPQAPQQAPYPYQQTQQTPPQQAYPSSGMQYSNYQTPVTGPVQPSNTMALVSMITGIVSLICMFLAGSIVFGVIGMISGIVGIVCGILAMKQIKENPNSSSKGMAIAGIVCGSVGLALNLIITIACISCYNSLSRFGDIPFNY